MKTGDMVVVVINGRVCWTGEVAYVAEHRGEVGVRDLESWGGRRIDEVKAEHVVVIG